MGKGDWGIGREKNWKQETYLTLSLSWSNYTKLILSEQGSTPLVWEPEEFQKAKSG